MSHNPYILESLNNHGQKQTGADSVTEIMSLSEGLGEDKVEVLDRHKYWKSEIMQNNTSSFFFFYNVQNNTFQKRKIKIANMI